MADLEFDLLHNALDFLVSAAEQSAKGDSRSLKYTLLHLDAAIELLLKARLSKEHWSLIFVDPDKATHRALEAGDFVSVDAKTALKRLEGIAGIAFNEDDKSKILKLRDHRNRVQHFAVNVKAETVKALLAFGCNFVLEFCRLQLPAEVCRNAEVVAGIKENLLQFEEYVRERLASIRGELDRADVVVRCPDCYQDAVVVGTGEEPNCLFCAEHKAAEAVAEEVSEGDVWECPECGEMALVLRISDVGGPSHWCVYCGEGDDYEECPRCGVMFSKRSDMPVCSDCWAALIAGSD